MLFHVKKSIDEYVHSSFLQGHIIRLKIRRYFSFHTECTSPKACTVLRGPSKDILDEINRNLADAMSVARNAVFHPSLAPGGGMTEMAIGVGLNEKAKALVGLQGCPCRVVDPADVV